jgi:hypothetical protein
MPTTIAVASPAIGMRDKILAVSSDRDLTVVAIFSTVGLLLAILFAVYFPLRLPDLGALIEQYY